MTDNLTIQVVYRNYIPLNSPYSSFWIRPPEGVDFIIPKVKKFVGKLFPIYQKFGNHWLISKAVKVAQNIMFKEKECGSVDILFYVGMLPNKGVTKPYIIDIEHAYALQNFVIGDDSSSIRDILLNPLCRAIAPLSQAAAMSLKAYLKDDFEKVKDRVNVIYPALPDYTKIYGNRTDHSFLSQDHFNLLFVGKDALRKGLQEVLPAFDDLQKDIPDLRLYVVSDCPRDLVKKYQSHPKIQFFTPRFSAEEMMTKFFLPSDVFVMPTHADTFGMVYLEALACGKPVVLTKQFATPEIVEDGFCGIMLKHDPLFLDKPGIPQERYGDDYRLEPQTQKQIISGIKQAVRRLYHDSKLYQSMSKAAVSLFQPGGKFAIDERNRKLKQLFQMAKTTHYTG